MRILFNALSVTNLSGRHVLLGHLSRLAKWTLGQHEYVVLYHKINRDICRNLGNNVQWVECSEYTSHWVIRSLWERIVLPVRVSKLGIDIYFTPAGTAVHSLRIPQIVFAQNPWCLVDGLKRSWLEKIKAFLQKREYRIAMRDAAMMVFNSEYMRHAYRENACSEEKVSLVVYQAIDGKARSAAFSMRNTEKRAYQVLSVSVMAPHKGIETLVKAIGTIRKLYGIPVKLVLVGGWPDSKYEHLIRSLIIELNLESEVEIKGHVSDHDLYRYYAESKLFCLMSRCESFGIPAIEAQAFGTPVVSSNCCAIPEVCGKGGVYFNPDNVNGVASQIAQLLEDDKTWSDISDAAIENAEKYRWEMCSKPLVKMFDIVANVST